MKRILRTYECNVSAVCKFAIVRTFFTEQYLILHNSRWKTNKVIATKTIKLEIALVGVLVVLSFYSAFY